MCHGPEGVCYGQVGGMSRLGSCGPNAFRNLFAQFQKKVLLYIPQQCRGVSGTELGLRQATTRQHKNTVGVRVPSSERVGSENRKILRPARGDWGQN